MAHFEGLSAIVNETMVPGSFLVDLIPIREYHFLLTRLKFPINTMSVQ